MRNLPRTEYRVPCLQVVQYASHLDQVFPGEDIKPLVLTVMKVSRRTSLFRVVMLHREEISTAILGRYLKA